MTPEEMIETIESLSRLAEDFARVTNSLRAVTVRNEVRGFYEHLTTGVEVPDGDGGMRTLDPDTDRDVVIPGTRFTLGEVLDWQFSLAEAMAFLNAEPGQAFTSPGFVRRMYGFVTPSSTV